MQDELAVTLARPAVMAVSRPEWPREAIATLFDLPFTELVFRAAEVHRAHHDPTAVQRSTLL